MHQLVSSLRYQLIGIVLLAVLPAIALILYSGFDERTSAALQAQKHATKLVELASAQKARVIGEARSLLYTLSQSPHGCLTEAPQCSANFREILARHPHYLNIGIAGADGGIICSALPLEAPAGSMRGEFFEEALEGEGFAIGSSRFDPRIGKASSDDDILDALASLWTAGRIQSGKAVCVLNKEEQDEFGLPMRMWA
ncbi:MAG: hypothetical protein ABSF90_30905 [Syntrophobacteraceae bacterium]|jgi:hypothetical protein